MKMTGKTVQAEAIFPLLAYDAENNVAISRRGCLTKGWELTLAPTNSQNEKEYDDAISVLASAMRTLPSWTIVHRQDLYLREKYCKDESCTGFIARSREAHFDGREGLTHRTFLYVTFAQKPLLEKESATSSGILGIRGAAPVPERKKFNEFIKKCDEFSTVITNGKHFSCRPLVFEDWFGDESYVGLVHEVMMMGDRSHVMSSVQLGRSEIGLKRREVIGYSIGEAEYLPSVVNSTSKVDALSSTTNELFMSNGAKIGTLLDCDHIINQYIEIPDQNEIHASLDKRRRQEVSNIKSKDNEINSAETEEYLEYVYRHGVVTVKTHLNLLAWNREGENVEDVVSKCSAALATMGVTATQNIDDMHRLYYAAIPGNAYEIGASNMMTLSLKSVLALGAYETFNNGVPHGVIHTTDRFRHIPIPLDIQEVARRTGMVVNPNFFVNGASGTGKSFLMNSILSDMYDAGTEVFIIDVGDSYEVLTKIINEESGGVDGQYLVWDKNNQISFDLFPDIEKWIDANGALDQDEPGVNFIISFLETLWEPMGGWKKEQETVLKQTIIDFVKCALQMDRKPIFDDYCMFISNTVSEKIQNSEYVAGNTSVDESIFDVKRYSLSINAYSLQGEFAQFANSPNPPDVITSRFTVLEVDRLSQIQDKKHYSLCVLCILNMFDRKMRQGGRNKAIVIEEAWKAIANETMAPYLKQLWKTSRKYSTTAGVVTQELEDIVSSEIIKEAILKNSDIKILLDQSNNRNTFGPIQNMMSLTEGEKNLALSINLDPDPKYGKYKEFFIKIGDHFSGVFATEASRRQALAFESNKVEKQPLLNLAKEIGSITKAIEMMAEK